MIAFIDAYRDRFSVEFICQTLNRERAGGFVSSRGYRAAKTRPPSVRSLNDAVLIGEIATIFEANYRVYGVRKMWHALKRSGWSVGREQVARLMRTAGIRGVRRGRTPITTRKGRQADTRPDLVERQFTADRPNQLWVADMTYVRTKVGFVYTAFVTDVFSRKIVGWSTRSSMKTEALPLEALDQAIAQARDNLEGLVHHSDHGSQYVSIVYNDTLTGLGIKASTGTVGDSYDNALAETVNGLYKTELIYTGQWESLAEVEFATLSWVHWWNTARLHQALGYQTPEEVIHTYNQRRTPTPVTTH